MSMVDHSVFPHAARRWSAAQLAAARPGLRVGAGFPARGTTDDAMDEGTYLSEGSSGGGGDKIVTTTRVGLWRPPSVADFATMLSWKSAAPVVSGIFRVSLTAP